MCAGTVPVRWCRADIYQDDENDVPTDRRCEHQCPGAVSRLKMQGLVKVGHESDKQLLIQLNRPLEPCLENQLITMFSL